MWTLIIIAIVILALIAVGFYHIFETETDTSVREPESVTFEKQYENSKELYTEADFAHIEKPEFVLDPDWEEKVPPRRVKNGSGRLPTGINVPGDWPPAPKVEKIVKKNTEPKRESSTLIGVSNDRAVNPINDLSNPLNPLSPISIYNQSATTDDGPSRHSSNTVPEPQSWSAPEPTHTPSYSGSSYSSHSHSTPDPTPTPTHTPSHSDTSSHSSYSSPSHDSSSSHSSYDSSSHSSSYDSGSSSSFD